MAPGDACGSERSDSEPQKFLPYSRPNYLRPSNDLPFSCGHRAHSDFAIFHCRWRAVTASCKGMLETAIASPRAKS